MEFNFTYTRSARSQAHARGIDEGVLHLVLEHANRHFRLPSGGVVHWVSRRGRAVMYERGVSPVAAEETIGLRVTFRPDKALVTRVETTNAIRSPVFSQ